MNLDEECWIFCIPPYLVHRPQRIMTIGMIIVDLDAAVTGNMENVERSLTDEETKGFEKINKVLMKELATASTALAVINAYERAVVFTADMQFSMYNKLPMQTDAELNFRFDVVKTKEIVRIGPTCRNDRQKMVSLLDSSCYMHAVRNILKKAKLQA